MKIRRLAALLLSLGFSSSLFGCVASGGSSENGGEQNGTSQSQTETVENGEGGSTEGDNNGNNGNGGNGGNGGGETTHTHAWGAWSTTPATCLSAGKKVRVCSDCGDKEEQTIEKLRHTYSTTECTVCRTPLVASNGLIFKKGNDEYSAWLLYCTAEEIVIPATYEGLPVTHVNGSLYDETTNSVGTNTTTKHIYVPEGVTSFNFTSGFNALESISLPSTITKIPDQAFQFTGYETFTTIYYGGTAQEWIDLEKGIMWYHSTTNTLIASDGIERNLDGSMRGGLPSLFGRHDNNK